jgi:hypothetical protein
MILAWRKKIGMRKNAPRLEHKTLEELRIGGVKRELEG